MQVAMVSLIGNYAIGDAFVTILALVALVMMWLVIRSSSSTENEMDDEPVVGESLLPVATGTVDLSKESDLPKSEELRPAKNSFTLQWHFLNATAQEIPPFLLEVFFIGRALERQESLLNLTDHHRFSILRDDFIKMLHSFELLTDEDRAASQNELSNICTITHDKLKEIASGISKTHKDAFDKQLLLLKER